MTSTINNPLIKEIIDQCNRGLEGGDIVARRALEDIHDLCVTPLDYQTIMNMAKIRFNAAAPYLHKETLWDDLSAEGKALEVAIMEVAVKKCLPS